jgi:hypothetical protein
MCDRQAGSTSVVSVEHKYRLDKIARSAVRKLEMTYPSRMGPLDIRH